MPTLAEKLTAARDEVARLEREALSATCADLGHDWSHSGGMNAGCGLYCYCSVPVYSCRRCGDSDYGENAEAKQMRAECSGVSG